MSSIVWSSVLRRSSSMSCLSSVVMMEDVFRCCCNVSVRSLSSSQGNNNNNNPKSRRKPYRQLNKTSNPSQYSNSSNSNSKGSNEKDVNFLRSHAVSIVDGNYDDYENEGESEEEMAFPMEESASMGYYYKEKEEGGMEEMMMSAEEQEWESRMAERIYKRQMEEEAQRAKWIENAKMPGRSVQIDKRSRSYRRGGRKTSSARVWIMPGDGMVTVNCCTLLDYFPRELHWELLLSPFVATNTASKFDLTAIVDSGGLLGKAGAIRHDPHPHSPNYCRIWMTAPCVAPI